MVHLGILYLAKFLGFGYPDNAHAVRVVRVAQEMSDVEAEDVIDVRMTLVSGTNEHGI